MAEVRELRRKMAERSIRPSKLSFHPEMDSAGTLSSLQTVNVDP